VIVREAPLLLLELAVEERLPLASHRDLFTRNLNYEKSFMLMFYQFNMVDAERAIDHVSSDLVRLADILDGEASLIIEGNDLTEDFTTCVPHIDVAEELASTE